MPCIENITSNDIELFYNKYKYNSDLIIKLERRLLSESYNYEKWQALLIKNSELTRNLFTENEELIENTILPVIQNPELLSRDSQKFFLLSISFFLYENRIDSLATKDILDSFSRKLINIDSKTLSDTFFYQALASTILNHNQQINYSSLYSKSISNYQEIIDVADINMHIQNVFCKLAQLLDLSIQDPPDINMLIDCIYNTSTLIQNITDETQLSHMWGKNADFDFHKKLLQRYLKIYGIFALRHYSDEFNQNENNQILFEWLTDEYDLEKSENIINPMVFAIYHRYLYVQKKLTRQEYLTAMINEYDNLINSNITNYTYPENTFLIDDEPICHQFSEILNTVKVFNKSFTFIFVFLPDLLSLTNEKTLNIKIITNIKTFFEQMPFSEKGVLVDKFIIELIKIVLKQLTSVEEVLSFLQTIFVHRQITTAIHFTMVSKISDLCFDEFIKTNPDLFIGVLDTVTGADVLKQKENLRTFINNASYLHDIGKLYSSDIINLHFRKLTNAEFEIIKQHPIIGSEIVKNIPLLADFNDIVLGHHKTYDGKSGYPANFDNTKSPFRSIIDLIAICDSIDAATDILGRNYTKGKKFEIVLQELKEQAGTRYNPSMVNLIASNKKLITKISKLTNENRKDASYTTYHHYIKPHIYFTSSQEKVVIPYTKSNFEELYKFYSKAWNNQNRKQINDFISRIVSPKNFHGYILTDSSSKIYGIFFGRFFNAMENSPFSSNSFICDDFQVLTNLRRKGLGSFLLSEVERALLKQNCKQIQLNVIQDLKSESFFWINGFNENKYKLMKKIL